MIVQLKCKMADISRPGEIAGGGEVPAQVFVATSMVEFEFLIAGEVETTVADFLA